MQLNFHGLSERKITLLPLFNCYPKPTYIKCLKQSVIRFDFVVPKDRRFFMYVCDFFASEASKKQILLFQHERHIINKNV